MHARRAAREPNMGIAYATVLLPSSCGTNDSHREGGGGGGEGERTSNWNHFRLGKGSDQSWAQVSRKQRDRGSNLYSDYWIV